MPIYNFRCLDSKCDYSFEKLVKMGVEQVPCECEDCTSMAKKELATGKTGLSYRFNWLDY